MELAPVIPIHSKMPAKLPPELAARKDLTDMYLAGTRYARWCLRRHPKHVTTELVNGTFIKLATSHRWNPEKLPLEQWFLMLVRNDVMNFYDTKPDFDGETAAQYRHHEVEERCVEAMTPDEVMIEREANVERERNAWMIPAQIAAVAAAVANHPIASGVISEWQNHGTDLKPKQLARRLGVTERQVYSARDLIRYHARRVRERLENQGEAS